MFLLVKKMLARYYDEEFVVEVPALPKREVAVMYESKMLRHKHFESADALRRYLAKFPPLHVYYSTAYYSNPSAITMEAKGWEGADVVFDIDSDKFECDRYYKCLAEGHYFASVIYDIVTTELGVRPKVTFSGTRGFHIHIYELSQLSKDGRGHLLEYILGNYKRAEKYISNKAVYVKYGSFRRSGAKLIPQNAVDAQVLLDVHRLIRMPNTIHGKSGLKCMYIDINKSYDPYGIVEKASWALGYVKVVVESRPDKKDEIFPIECSGVCNLDAQTALFALLRGYAKPLKSKKT